MEELSGLIEDSLGELVETWDEILTTINVVQEVQNTPDIMVHVQNLDTSSNVVGWIAQYIPFFDQYTDFEFYLFCWITLVWILCVIRVLRDSMARSTSAWYHFFSVLLVIVFSPIIWIPLYLAFRPLVYKWDRWLWRESLEQDIIVCPHCKYLNKESHKMCVWCWEVLHTECKQCHNHYYLGYSYCPECWAPNLE